MLSQMHSVHNFHPVSVISILILFCYLRLGLPRDFFPSGYATKVFYVYLISPIRLSNLLDLISLITFGEVYKL